MELPNYAERLIMTPFDPGFYDILHSSLPPTSEGRNCYVARANSEILEAVSYEEAWEYAWGGEYDELDELDEDLDEDLLDDDYADLLQGVREVA
jgi:hypothetical protein